MIEEATAFRPRTDGESEAVRLLRNGKYPENALRRLWIDEVLGTRGGHGGGDLAVSECLRLREEAIWHSETGYVSYLPVAEVETEAVRRLVESEFC